MPDRPPPTLSHTPRNRARGWRYVVFAAILAPPLWLVFSAPPEYKTIDALFSAMIAGVLLGPLLIGLVRRFLQYLG